ncbi:MAG TPA: hypothetical protein VI078_09560 [bacterium]
MGRRAVAVAVAGMVLMVAGAVRAEGPAQVGAVVAATGNVQVGRDGAWQAASAKMPLFEGQMIRADEAAKVEVLFDGGLPATVAGKAEIAVSDLLLKAQLEKARAKIAAPTDATKAEMQVTPLTGVRGTEKAEEKAGDLKREHYWNEGAPAAK